MSSVKFDALFPVDHVEDLTARNSEYFAQFSLSVTTILAMDSEKLHALARDDVSGALDMLEFHAEAKHRLEEAIELNQAVCARLLLVFSEATDFDASEK